jgi:hypothetical protein
MSDRTDQISFRCITLSELTDSRMPMVIVILMNVENAITAIIVVLGIEQRQSFLTKSKKIMFNIERKRHTQSI